MNGPLFLSVQVLNMAGSQGLADSTYGFMAMDVNGGCYCV